MINKIKQKISIYFFDALFGIISSSLLIVSVLMNLGYIKFKQHIVQISGSISISFATTPNGTIFGMLIGTLYFCSFIYCLGYNKEFHNSAKSRFNALYAFSAISAFCVSISENLFTMFIFYETLTLSTYPLICFTKNKASIDAARKYLLYLIIPSLSLLLPSIMFIYHKCGNLNFATDGILTGAGLKAAEIEVLYLCMLYGIGKIAAIPFHGWLPTAMIASTPVSGLLHAVAVVKTGIFMLLTITYNTFGAKLLKNSLELFFGINWAAWIGILGAIIASLVAQKKYEIKARLAYSTIAHLSIMIALIATFNEDIMNIVMYYAFAHGIVKIILFYSNGIIYKATHESSYIELSGLGNLAPFGFGAFLIGIIGILGIHGSAMYHIKHEIIHHLIHENTIIMLTIFFTSLSAVVYLGKIPYFAFCRPTKQNYELHAVDYRMKISVSLIIILNLMMYFKIILPL
ncbi:proton-conducting transporter transmembrane domain-containing protein [Candidatus Deianiraea vastatrix]|uniref:Proton/sodium antiporter n=1 Tax=Candidatus Deianiraea vastatrix TaxID=2163644 RepID=A0A5B8XDU5_9RICK|nr:proton-conducting transporter membrane subunit [Candidatus Deianiraea vastatrix]QED23519.1 Putative proton/sodium antiporter [Candidatus Deianiraea vastatrix]